METKFNVGQEVYYVRVCNGKIDQVKSQAGATIYNINGNDVPEPYVGLTEVEAIKNGAVCLAIECQIRSEKENEEKKSRTHIVEYEGQKYRKVKSVFSGVKDCKLCCFNHGKDCWCPREEMFDGCANDDFHWEKVKEIAQ